MKVAIYSRKSKLTGKGESIQNQIDLCKEYIVDQFGIDEFIIYEDEGFSGGTSDRPQYKKMLLDARAKRFSILICYRLDRISRNICDFSETIETLNSLDISFISLREQFDTSTPMGRAMMYIASVFAQLERETIAERIKDNMLSLARTGRWLGGNPPTGYISHPIYYYDDMLNKKTMYKLKQVPDEIATVKILFDKYLELRSLSQVEVWALRENLRTKNGKLFDIRGIKGILTNMVYVVADKKMCDYCESLGMDISSDISHFDGSHGLMVYNKNIVKKGQANKLKPTCEWIVSVGKHKAIISSKHFIEVQKLIAKNKVKAPQASKNTIYLLSPFLKCQSCKSSLRTTYGRKRKDGTRPYYYKCILKEKSRGSKCKIKNLNGRHADDLMVKQIKVFTISYENLYNLLKKERKNTSFLYSQAINEKTEIEKSINKYKTMISKLTSSLAFTSNEKSSQYIVKQIEDLDGKIVKCREELNHINLSHKMSEEHKLIMDGLINIIYNFKKGISTLSHQEKKYIIESLIESILWDGASLKAYLK